MTSAAPRASSAPAPPALRVLCLSGPNLQLLGTREPHVYGRETLHEIHQRLDARGGELDASVVCKQSNHEGELLDWLAEARGTADGVLINAAALTHTSIALYDAIKAISLPVIEVHLSNPDAREEFRRHSTIAAAVVARIAGFGSDSYLLALEGLVRLLRRRAASAATLP